MPADDDAGRVLVPMGLEDPDHPGVTNSWGRNVVYDPATDRAFEPSEAGRTTSITLSPRGELVFHELAAPFDYSRPVTLVVLDLETGARRELAPMPISWPASINDRGQVAFSSGIGVGTHAFVWDPVAGLIDLDQERKRLRAEIERLDGQVAGAEKKLSNEQFVGKAPPEVVQKEREKVGAFSEQRSKLREKLSALEVS